MPRAMILLAALILCLGIPTAIHLSIGQNHELDSDYDRLAKLGSIIYGTVVEVLVENHMTDPKRFHTRSNIRIKIRYEDPVSGNTAYLYEKWPMELRNLAQSLSDQTIPLYYLGANRIVKASSDHNPLFQTSKQLLRKTSS